MSGREGTTYDTHRPRRAGFSDRSLGVPDASPGVLTGSSTDAGWTSLLLQRVRRKGSSRPFTPPPTPDVWIGVALRGTYEVTRRTPVGLRVTAYRPGAACLAHAGDPMEMSWSAGRDAVPFETAHLFVPERFFDEALDHYRAAGSGVRRFPHAVPSSRTR